MAWDVRQLVGANVRHYRLLAQMTQADLAAVMGVDRAYVSGLERGMRNVTILSLWHTARALGVTLAALVEEPAISPNRQLPSSLE
jgi:transcriptional regulator with XRE-family HTH domain